jgi:serine phosphatase RsbU (regulator of sigma subunit)
MKKIGKIIIPLGVLLIFTGTYGVSVDQHNPLPYFVAIFGLLFSFFGISFLFFDLPYETRKKRANLLLYIGLIFLTYIFLYIALHLTIPGISIIVVCTACFLSFSYLPLLTKNRIEKWKQYTRKSWHAYLLSIGDLISISALILGYLFRKMHWPGAMIMMTLGIIILAACLIGWNRLFSGEIVLRKKAEEKLRDTLQEVEEKQKEITDSINYAKRIQEAIFPSQDFIKSNLPDYFLYYQPKDIVAGDFYWADKIDNTFLIASADCTGHGVPGALVSVVCCNALYRSANEFKLIEPGKILDKTRELVLESFSKNGGDIKDGMDISLVCISDNIVKWAGANNPLWYFQNNELKEIKPNKQPIGKTDNPLPFTTHTIELQKGDLIYLFTDGFADQFGGPKGKKFKYKQFEELLVKSKDLSLNKQHEILKITFNNWKGNLEQIDDISVIGIRF